MRMILLLSFLFLVPLNAWTVGEQPLLKDKADRINYSLGYNLGHQLQPTGLEFNPDLLWVALNEGLAVATPRQTSVDFILSFKLGQEIAQHQLEFRGPALWQGLYDSVYQGPPRVEETLMTQLLVEVRGLPESTAKVTGQDVQPVSVKPQAPPPKAYRLPGQKFLAENGTGQDVISLPSGLQYRILATGTGKTPKATDSVLVSYRGTSIEGKVFSSSAPMGINMPEEVAVNKVIPGWKQALQMMREGDRWELYIPTRLAFKDSSPMAGQTVIYDLELVEVLPEFR